MNSAELSRFDELVSRYLDDPLTDAEAAELIALLTEPSHAMRFLELTRLNSTIAGLLAAPVPDAAMVELVRSDIEHSAGRTPIADAWPFQAAERPQPRTSVSRRRNPALQALAWAAVVLVFCGLAAGFLIHRTRLDGTPAIASVQGQPRVLGRTGERMLRPGDSWRLKDKILTVGPKSAATVKFRDGSQLIFGGDTVAANESGSAGRRVVLERGSVQAVVNDQPTRRPFVFATPDAEAVVVGTKLRLVAGGHHTRLDVIEGEVRFRRRHDGAEVTVKADHYAVAAPNVPLIATPFHPEPHHAQ